MTILSWFAIVFGAAAALGIGYTLATSVLIGRFFARDTAQPTHLRGVTIVKPLYGDERALLENLSSFCRQDYPGPVQYLFGVHDANDPALLTVDALRHRFPDAQLTVIVDARLHGPNRKLSNILNMMPKARHDVLVFADSDVSVAPDYLRNVVGELQRPDVGAVSCLYRGVPDPGFWPRLSAMAINYQFIPSAVTGIALGMARPCFGQTIAMRRETYDALGGFEPFVHLLAEDHAIGEAVRALGKAVVIPPFAIIHASVENSAAAVFSHELRWSRTIRVIDPAGHLGSVVTHPFALSVLTAGLSGVAMWSCWLLAAALAARFVLKWAADRAFGQPSREPWLLPVWDLVAFAIFMTSLFSTRVVWRGHKFQVKDGCMSSSNQD